MIDLNRARLINDPNALIVHVADRLAQHRDNLALWQEPNGLLIPTEPDADERRLVRAELRACIYELEQLARFFIGATNAT